MNQGPPKPPVLSVPAVPKASGSFLLEGCNTLKDVVDSIPAGVPYCDVLLDIGLYDETVTVSWSLPKDVLAESERKYNEAVVKNREATKAYEAELFEWFRSASSDEFLKYFNNIPAHWLRDLLKERLSQ